MATPTRQDRQIKLFDFPQHSGRKGWKCREGNSDLHECLTTFSASGRSAAAVRSTTSGMMSLLGTCCPRVHLVSNGLCSTVRTNGDLILFSMREEPRNTDIFQLEEACNLRATVGLLDCELVKSVFCSQACRNKNLPSKVWALIQGRFAGQSVQTTEGPACECVPLTYESPASGYCPSDIQC